MARTTPDQAECEHYALASSASHLLHRAEQLAAERFAELAKDALTLRQFAVLAAIASDPGLSQSALVRITETVPLPEFATYATSPAAVIATPTGLVPTVIVVGETVLVDVAITDTVLVPEFVT